MMYNWLQNLSVIEQNVALGIVGSLLAAVIIFILKVFITAIRVAWDLHDNTRFSWLPKEWLCEWEPKSPNKPAWVSETLVIRQFFGTVIIENRANNYGYQYTAKATLASGSRLGGRYLIGTWSDTTEGAIAAGVFVLAIAQLGRSMFGFIVGPNDDGRIMYGKYVVGRTTKDVELAKQRLSLPATAL